MIMHFLRFLSESGTVRAAASLPPGTRPRTGQAARWPHGSVRRRPLRTTPTPNVQTRTWPALSPHWVLGEQLRPDGGVPPPDANGRRLCLTKAQATVGDYVSGLFVPRTSRARTRLRRRPGRDRQLLRAQVSTSGAAGSRRGRGRASSKDSERARGRASESSGVLKRRGCPWRATEGEALFGSPPRAAVRLEGSRGAIATTRVLPTEIVNVSRYLRGRLGLRGPAGSLRWRDPAEAGGRHCRGRTSCARLRLTCRRRRGRRPGPTPADDDPGGEDLP